MTGAHSTVSRLNFGVAERSPFHFKVELRPLNIATDRAPEAYLGWTTRLMHFDTWNLGTDVTPKIPAAGIHRKITIESRFSSKICSHLAQVSRQFGVTVIEIE